MYCFATYIGQRTYDVSVWTSEAASQNDDGARAIARATVTISIEEDAIAGIRRAMELDDADVIELN